MKWLFMPALVAADIFIAIRFGSQEKAAGNTEYAQWGQLAVMCVIFGPLCILFPDRLGRMEGKRSDGWFKPTPACIVTAIGWLFLTTPLVVLCLLL